jgi:hypothetical protein
MNIIYFYLTNKTNLSLFEHDKLVLNKKEFNSEVENIILQLRENQINLDMAFMAWMTEESTRVESARAISSETQEHLLTTMSFKYSQSVILDLFSYYNFFPKHKQYSFIKHGYPINIEMEFHDSNRYIVFKEEEEVYDTFMVSGRNDIEHVLKQVIPNSYITLEDLKISSESVLLLQGVE